MVGLTRKRARDLVNNRHKQVGLAVLAIVVLIGVYVLANAKTVNVNIDGGTTTVFTVSKEVGKVLQHSGLGIYPEDVVVPSRETLVSKGITINVTRSSPVSLSIDGKIIKARTPAQNVDEAVNDLSNRFGLGIKSVDEVNQDRTEPVVANMELEVKRSIPIHVVADGKEWDTYLAPRTVAEALTKLSLSLGDMDRVSLPLNQVLEPNDKLQIIRVTEKIETVKNEIPYQVVAQPADFPVGLPDKTLKKGSNGLHEQTVKLTFEDGKEVDRYILNQRVVQAPVNQIVSRGAQTSVSRGGRVIDFKRAYIMRASAYCDPGGMTATGASVRYGVVAVDPRVIPLGSHLYVDGYGDATALDTGGAIKGNKIDLYMESEDAALAWGIRQVIVYVK
ncbi:MAG: ubiquitin-like domain-containing protein [Desulfitobacterium hafniense]|nr:ubiquitin-like domain-containing protein [Desulfitobacterium hafniense]